MIGSLKQQKSKNNWSCFWGHDWTKWQPTPYSVVDSWSKDKTPFKVMYQDRKCKVCGKTQSERL